MKKTIAITILSTIVVGFIILLIIGLNMEDENPVTIVDNESRDTFIKSCIGDTANYPYCACGYDYIINTYGEKGMMRIFNKIDDTKPLPDEIIETYNYCKYLNN